MTFLTGWRIVLATDLARTWHDRRLVAHKVGYGRPSAFSTALKRVRGMSPQEHRNRGA